MSKYEYNKDYFEKIDTADKAYWFGFTCADGYIGRFYRNEKLKSMTLEFKLQRRDKKHLEKFLKCLESNLTVRDYDAAIKDKKYPSCRLSISCTKMCRDLIDLGCTPEKTFTLRFPNPDVLPTELRKDFLRGFFDGDGCISVSEMAGKPHIFCSFSGAESIINDLANILVEERVIRKKPTIKKDKRNQCFSFNIYGIDSVYEFLSYLYDGANCYLDRKYETYKAFYKNFNYKESKHGVYWSKRNSAYVATICEDGIHRRIGQSKDIDKAIQMRKEAEINKMKISK